VQQRTGSFVSDRAERVGLERELQDALDPGEAAAMALAELLRAEGPADR
jgi:predicted nucleic acid-binding protein